MSYIAGTGLTSGQQSSSISSIVIDIDQITNNFIKDTLLISSNYTDDSISKQTTYINAGLNTKQDTISLGDNLSFDATTPTKINVDLTSKQDNLTLGDNLSFDATTPTKINVDLTSKQNVISLGNNLSFDTETPYKILVDLTSKQNVISLGNNLSFDTETPYKILVDLTSKQNVISLGNNLSFDAETPYKILVDLTTKQDTITLGNNLSFDAATPNKILVDLTTKQDTITLGDNLSFDATNPAKINVDFSSVDTNKIVQLINFTAPSEEYDDVALENSLIINTNDITFKAYTTLDFPTGNATYNELKIVSEGNAIAFETINNNLILYKFDDGATALRCVNNDIKIVDNDGDELSLRQVSLDIKKLRYDATMAQIMDGLLTFSGWAGSAAMDATMLAMLAKMRAQLAGLFTVSAMDPYELFTDIVDGIGDIEDPADIAGQLEDLKFTQTEVNQAVFRFIAHIKQAHNYKVSHNTQVYPLGLDDYENLIFTQSIGLGTPPRFDDNEGISTLMYGKTGINNNLYVAGDIYFNSTFDGLDLLPAHDYFTNKTSLTSSLNSKQNNLILGANLSFDINQNLQVDLSGLQDALTFFHPIINTNNVITLLYNAAYFELIDSKLSIKSSVLTAKQDNLTLGDNLSFDATTPNKINVDLTSKQDNLTLGDNLSFDATTPNKINVDLTNVTGSVWTKSDNNDISYTDGNVTIKKAIPKIILQGTDFSDYPSIGFFENASTTLNYGFDLYYNGGNNNLQIRSYDNSVSPVNAISIKRGTHFVGIGTDSQEKKLSVYGTDTENANLEILASFSSKQAVNGAAGIGFGCLYQTLKSGIIHERLASYGRGSLHICNNNEANTEDFTMNDVKLTITNEGNVGINCSPGDYKLDINGDTRINGNLTFKNHTTQFYKATDGLNKLIIIPCTKSGYWSTLKVKISIVGENANGSADTRYEYEAEGSTYQHVADLLITKLSTLQTYIKVVSKWDGLVEGTIDAPKVLIYIDPNGVPYLTVKVELFGSYNVKFENGSIATFQDTFPNNNDFAGTYEHYLGGNLDITGTYKINGSDITTDDISQGTTNLYYNYTSTAGQLNTLLKHSGSGMASFLRFRGGGSPGGNGGVCLSSYDNNNFFIYAYGDDLTIRYSDAFTTSLDTGNQPIGTDLIKLNDSSLNVNVPINTTGTLSIDANNTADFELLKFDTARPWSFWNRGTGGSTALELRSTADGKYFNISNKNGSPIAKFHADTTNNFVALSRLSVGPNLNTPQHTLDVDGDVNISSGSKYKINGSDISTDDISETTTKKYSQWTTSGNDISYSLGDIGVGTDSPSQQLEVRGIAAISDGIYFRGIITPNSFTPTASRNWRISTGQSQEGTFQIGCRNDYNDTIPNFFTNPEFARMTIKHNGYVGVGLTNPLAKLHTEGGNIIFNSAGEASDLIIGLGTPHTNSCYKSAIILDAANSYSRNNMHFCLRNTADNSTNAGIGDAKLSILRAGNVGLGTSNPSEKLHVMGRALIDVATKIGDMGHANHAGMSHVSQFGPSTYAFLQNANGQTLVNAKSGQVILMKNNNNATLMQIGASSTGNVSQRYMQRDGFVANSVSINTVVKVVGTLHATGVLVVTSDIRIKENVRELDDDECLSIVRKLNPCKYNYKDPIKKGIHDVIGFISQEVEAVFPQATSRDNTEYIPSHYEKCEVANDIIKTTKSHEFIVGDKLKFYDSEDKELLHEVIEIIDEYTFKINETLEYTELFIYGKEVNDLCILDKASIFTLNVSATQQLDRIITKQQAIIDDLLKRIEALEG